LGDIVLSAESEKHTVHSTLMPNTVTTLKQDFAKLGVEPGSVIIMHSAMSKLGWTVGGPVAVIEALLELLTADGTLVMPAHTSGNSDPTHWQNPPVPENWWQIIRDTMPAFRPEITPTRVMGAIAETFRTWPGTIRSQHPQGSFAAWGKQARFITAPHPLESQFGEASPLARIYELNGQILLLGVTHENNTSLHLAEHRSDFPGKRTTVTGGAMLVNGKRAWVTWEVLDYNADDFAQVGKEFEASIGYLPGKVGQATAQLVSQRAIVDYAVNWFAANRKLPADV
jgi:aminoglycoside 3-N-acetyltransferase